MSLGDTFTRLFNVVAENTKLEEENFFLKIESKLNILCEEIAAEICADSAAVFFVTESNLQGGPYMVMRGASGRLKIMYDIYRTIWYQFARNNKKNNNSISDGFTSALTTLVGRIINQIWQQEKGIIANSNREVDLIGFAINRIGKGDNNAYPGHNLYTSFRNLIYVPIFAHGGRKVSDSVADEFHSKYRVIGFLKLEGKRPFFMETPDVEAIRDELESSDVFSKDQKAELKSWCQELWVQDNPILAAFSDGGKKFPLWLQKKEALDLRKDFVDILTKYCYAEFTHQKMELLVLWAAQAGRLMIRRIIHHAADNGIIISEDEVRILNIHWHDIEELVTLRQAAEAAMRKVKFCLESLITEINFEKSQTAYWIGNDELVEPRGPIREIESRPKEISSLLHKLVRKQLQFHETFSASQHDTQVDIIPRIKNYDITQPLVKRILEYFKIDDLAGIRIITDYESDIDELFDELRACITDWGISISKVENHLHEAKKGGYRALHITLEVDVRPLMEESDIEILHKALDGQNQGSSPYLKIPVEIQLRTDYQHSWAIKTHHILYKREEHITPKLLEQQEILSNVLAEADRLSDNVRSSIEDLFSHSDFGERKLLEQLKYSVLKKQDMAVFKFGIACAKGISSHLLRYNGQPEYSFDLEVCERLFLNFKVTDVKMFLLILLRNVWRHDLWISDISISDFNNGSIILQFYNQLEKLCYPILLRYQKMVCNSPEQTWLDWFEQLPGWFWMMQACYRDYFSKPREDRTLQWKDRLRNISMKIYHKFPREETEPEAITRKRKEWLERAYMMEAATLMASLAELSFEPGQILRKRLYNEYLALFREICSYFPTGYIKDIVTEELDRAFREMEATHDFPHHLE